MTLNVENYQATVRNTNENTVMISQNVVQPKPSVGFKEVDYLDTLDSVDRTSYDRFRSGNYCCSCCCCAPNPGIKGSICNQIVKCIINLILAAGAYILSFSSMDEYKGLRDDYFKGKEFLKNNNYIYGFYQIYSSYKAYWFDLIDLDKKFLFYYFICLALLFLFLIIEMIIYKTAIKKQKENGILQYIMIFFNGLFFIVFRIFVFVIAFDIVVYIIVLIVQPFKLRIEVNGAQQERSVTEFEDKWISSQNRVVGASHIVLSVLLFIFNFILNTMDKTFFLYADMNYSDTNENLTNDDKSKNISISIGGKSIDINIKKKRLCLHDLSLKHKFTFKQVLLKGITNNHINFKLGNKAVDNMLSITDWDYPVIDPIFNCLGDILKNLYYNLYFIYLPIKFHANNYAEYMSIKLALSFNQSIKFASIFKIYGKFENFVTESRFYVYLVISILLLLLQLKRVYFGGTSKKIFIILSFILSILLIIINVVYIILSFVLAVFSVLCILTIKDFKMTIKTFGIILYFQIALNLSFSSEFIYSIQFSGRLCELLNDIKNDYNKLINNDIPEEEKKTEIQFTGQDLSQHTLKEYLIEGHPRYLYYELDNSENKEVVNNNNQVIIQINNKEEFKTDDKIPDIDMLVLND